MNKMNLACCYLFFNTIYIKQTTFYCVTLEYQDCDFYVDFCCFVSDVDFYMSGLSPFSILFSSDQFIYFGELQWYSYPVFEVVNNHF